MIITVRTRDRMIIIITKEAVEMIITVRTRDRMIIITKEAVEMIIITSDLRITLATKQMLQV
jgi:hypothetical protein